MAKLLFLVDFGAYARFGESITGALYWADELGPTPADEMIATRDLESNLELTWENPFDKQTIPVPQRAARVELFKRHQLAYVDHTMERYQQFRTQELIDVAHDFPGWIYAYNHKGRRAPIPYEAVFWSPVKKAVTAEEEAHARHLAEEFDLPRA